MNLEVYYTAPVGGKVKNLPITSYVTDVTWSGSVDQAARKVEFSVAYNTANKDISFIPVDVKLGGTIDMFYTDGAQPRVQFFSGKVFFRKRNTKQFTYDIVCYDAMIYLAKNKIQKKFADVSITDAINQVCKEAGIEVTSTPSIETKFNYIADGKSCTEVLKQISDTNVAAGGKPLTAYCNLGKIVVTEKGQNLIEGYTATDSANVEHSEHSESIENMINRVLAVDDEGTIAQVYQVDDNIKQFGQLQEVFKLRPPKDGETVDNAKEAQSKLHGVQSESSLVGLGNIQCITGYTITVQEEQLQGKFFIKSDNHKFSDNVHTMTLTLEYVPDENEKEPEVTVTNIATPVFNSSNAGSAGNTGSRTMSVSTGLQAGARTWVGATMQNGSKGCVEAAGKVGSYYSPFLAKESKSGVAGVSRLVSDAQKSGVGVVSYNSANLQKGDVIVYGQNKHVVIYDGNGGYYGNSSSRNKIIHGSNYLSMSGLKPTKIIKTGGGK